MSEKKNIKKKGQTNEKKEIPPKQRITNKTSIKKKPKPIKSKKTTKIIINKLEITLPSILKELNYKVLIFRLLILTLVMMLIIFSIAKFKKYQENKNRIINKNIDTILNTSIKYYETNPLPVKVGDSSSFLLEEIKNLTKMEDIKDEDNKECNYLDSYIILTKTSLEDYRLKIHLKCNTKEKIRETKLLCKEEKCTTKK